MSAPFIASPSPEVPALRPPRRRHAIAIAAAICAWLVASGGAEAQPEPEPEPDDGRADVDLAPDSKPGPGTGPEAEAEARAKPRNIYIRAGVLHLMPFADSEEVVLSEVGGPAGLAIENGPIPGSGTGVDSTTMFAVAAGYVLPYADRRFSVEGLVLAVPFPVTIGLTAEGTLADEPLAPEALGIPTEVPALGHELGEVTALPLLATVVYNHLRGKLIQPYVGLGLSYLIPISGKVKNDLLKPIGPDGEPIEPEFRFNRLSFGNLGFVGQIGLEVAFGRYFINADLKYIEKLQMEATVADVYVATPGLPLFETVRLGNATAGVGVDPLLIHVSAGMLF